MVQGELDTMAATARTTGEHADRLRAANRQLKEQLASFHKQERENQDRIASPRNEMASLSSLSQATPDQYEHLDLHAPPRNVSDACGYENMLTLGEELEELASRGGTLEPIQFDDVSRAFWLFKNIKLN